MQGDHGSGRVSRADVAAVCVAALTGELPGCWHYEHMSRAACGNPLVPAVSRTLPPAQEGRWAWFAADFGPNCLHLNSTSQLCTRGRARCRYLPTAAISSPVRTSRTRPLAPCRFRDAQRDLRACGQARRGAGAPAGAAAARPVHRAQGRCLKPQPSITQRLSMGSTHTRGILVCWDGHRAAVKSSARAANVSLMKAPCMPFWPCVHPFPSRCIIKMALITCGFHGCLL